MKFMIGYINALHKTTEGLVFSSHICEVCLNNDLKERRRWEKIKKVIEYIYINDRQFYNYCYGAPISGYEQDMERRAKAVTSGNAEIRQQKARRLLNDYLFKTIDDWT